MATDVIIPVLGMAQDSGRLVKWLIQPGQAVARGDILFEVETDKAVVEIEAPADGVLGPWLVAEGEVVPVTQVVVRLYGPGETPGQAAPQPEQTSEPAASARPAPVPASPLASRIAAFHDVDLALVRTDGGKVQKADVLAYLAAGQAPAGRVLASPKARRLASERNLSLAAVRGTGPEGAVLAGDVLAHTTQIVADWPAMPEPAPLPAPAAATESPGVPVSTPWRIMAERTTQAWTGAPHFFLQRRALARRLQEWQRAAQSSMDVKITTSDLLVMLCARALVLHPQVNSAWSDGRLVASPGVHVGLAVAQEDGLVVPVIHHANQLGLREIAQNRADLVARAREGRLRLDDLAGGTFTISNLGMFGVERFLAILNPPQAAILAVGAIHDQVLPIDGQVSIQPVLELTVTFDHRVVDGARGARFLQTLVAFIEEPLQILA